MSDQVSTLINGTLYLTGAHALRSGFVLRKNAKAKPLYRSRFYWLCIISMILVNGVFLHLIYPSFWLRITFISLLMTLITLSFIPHLNIQEQPTTGEWVVKVVIFLLAGTYVLIPLTYVLTQNIMFYILITVLTQLVALHIWLGCLCALMMSDVIQMHYKKSILDSLTNIYNRRYFIDYVKSPEVNHAETHALIICDLDDFKDINDTYGHQQGDQAIKAFATLLKDHISRDDIVARIGGEEFAIFLRNMSAAEAEIVAQRICDLTKTLNFTDGDTTYGITASFGIATFGKNCQFTDALNQADKAMYRAKEAGKSQVRFTQ